MCHSHFWCYDNIRKNRVSCGESFETIERWACTARMKYTRAIVLFRKNCNLYPFHPSYSYDDFTVLTRKEGLDKTLKSSFIFPSTINSAVAIILGDTIVPSYPNNVYHHYCC